MQSFSEMNLSEPLLRAVSDLGFTEPTPIQVATLPILLGPPTDFLGLAATGTGKTAAYSLPMLEKIDSEIKAVQSLILCPTRELALQVAGQINLLGKHKGIRSVAVYGGASYSDQINGLRRGATVVVGTPGRVIDHIERGNLKLDQMKVLILDEADEMISMGFKEELEKVLEALPRATSNIWLFSATMNRMVGKVAETYLRAPRQVQINRTEVLSATVEQFYYPTKEGNKPEILTKLIEAADDFYGLIFCQTKSLVADLTQYLTEKGYKVDCLHGDKDQTSRERTMSAFRSRRVRILICTDVASRGLDVKDITHVVNYSLPRELDNYVHRIGRTARSGKTGIAMNLVTPSHRHLIYKIEQMTKSRMQEGRIPGRREIGAKKVAAILPSFSDQPFHTRAIEVMGTEWETALAAMTPQEVAARFMTMLLPEVFGERSAGAPAANTPVIPNPQASAPMAETRVREEAPRRERAERPSYRSREERPRSHMSETRPYRKPDIRPRASESREDRPYRKPVIRPRAAAGPREDRPHRKPDLEASPEFPGKTRVNKYPSKTAAAAPRPGSTKLGNPYPKTKRRADKDSERRVVREFVPGPSTR